MNDKDKGTDMNTQNMQSLTIPGASKFKFSAVHPDDLSATEYTLVTIAVDVSSSVHGFATELKSCVKAIIDAARKSPKADNLLVRLISFDTDLREVFGFKALIDIDTRTIDNFTPAGMTALYDAGYETLGATEQYAKLLFNLDFVVNAALYVITDGWDTASVTAHPRLVAECLQSIRKAEKLESIITLLIGINTKNPNVADALAKFAKQAAFDQFIDAGDATAENLAKIAGYVSKSITSQSQALGSGTASQIMSF